MKKVPVAQAVGMTLCHDITAMRDGFMGVALRRGHVIGPDDVEALDMALKGIEAAPARACSPE